MLAGFALSVHDLDWQHRLFFDARMGVEAVLCELHTSPKSTCTQELQHSPSGQIIEGEISVDTELSSALAAGGV